MFFGCTAQPDSKETELRGSDQEAFLLAGKNTRVILVPYHTRKYVPSFISGGI